MYDLTNFEGELIIDEEIIIPTEYYENTKINELLPIKVNGSLKRLTTEEIMLTINVFGIMKLDDSISLEEVEYPFSFEIEEKIEENEENLANTLEIIPILWENIVLEIPLKFTKVSDLSKFHGDGWKLVSEEDAVKKNNPFHELLNNYKEED